MKARGDIPSDGWGAEVGTIRREVEVAELEVQMADTLCTAAGQISEDLLAIDALCTEQDEVRAWVGCLCDDIALGGGRLLHER